MPADKKITRKDLPRPEEKDVRHKNQEEFDEKPKNQKPATDGATSDRKGGGKKKGMNYVIKDLPIY